MLSVKQIATLLRNHLTACIPGAVVGVSGDSGGVPSYRTSDIRVRVPICRASSSTPEIRRVCAGFYRRLPLAAGEETCPFGISLRYLKTAKGPRPFGFYSHQAFDINKVDQTVLQVLGRQPKKIAKQAIDSTKDFQHTQVDTAEAFQEAEEILETLSAGRVASSVRELAHQVLTPIQGAIADALTLEGSDKRLSKQIGGNLQTVADLATKIHTLLSETGEPVPQSLRRTLVHDHVKGICEQLRRAAEERHVEIRPGYNNFSQSVYAQPEKLRIALTCLIENAVKYSFDGFAGRPNFVEIKYSESDKNLEISISNIGVSSRRMR